MASGLLHTTSSPFFDGTRRRLYTTHFIETPHPVSPDTNTHDSPLQHSLLCLSVYGLVVTKKELHTSEHSIIKKSRGRQGGLGLLFLLVFSACCFDIFLWAFGSGVSWARRGGVGERFPCITQRYNSEGGFCYPFLRVLCIWAGFGLERSWTRELSQAELRLTDPDFGSGTRDGMEFGVGTQHTD